MSIFKRIIALFCSIAMPFSLLCTPAIAITGEEVAIGIGLFDLALNLYDRWKEAHPNEPDSAYPGFNPGGAFGGGVSRDELSQKYNDYVAALPSTGYTSDGAILWQPTVKDVVTTTLGQQIFYYAPPLLDDFRTIDSLPSGISELDDGTGYKITGRYTNGEFSSFDFKGFGWKVPVRFPIDGLYAPVASTKAHGVFFYADGSSSTYVENWPQSDFRYRVAGTSYMIGMDRFFVSAFTDSRGVLSYNFSWFFPFFKIIPDAALNDVDYGMVTRPTSIEGGNYGIVGDNGQITKVENNSTIVNETNNTYYNPATGQTAPITDWTYDYSDRSYTVNLEGGKTSTVTYGDEYITIQEGDTVYNIYYLVDGSGSENPPTACVHEWQETSTTPATCTLSGSRLLTCSKCQQTKSETVPALGHDWQIKQTITTQYDDTGQLVQQGYTIYQCSRCGAQYKSTDGTAPPGSGSGSGPEDGESIWDKIGGLLGTVVNGILDLLGSLVDTVLGGLVDLITNLFETLKQLVDLFGSVGEAFGVLWTWLPPEITAVLVTGVSIFVFVALLKFFMN